MNLEELEQIAVTEREAREKVKHEVRVCMAAGCLSCQSQGVKDALTAEVKNRGLEETHKVKGVGCMGLCSEGPLVATSDKQMYKHVAAGDAAALVDSLNSPCGSDIPVRQGSVEPGSVGSDKNVRTTPCPTDVPFFQRQKKIVLENSGVVDPERIEDYIAEGGYRAIVNALSDMTPQEVISEITTSGLRGRGGAGYPTGLKWSTVSKADGNPKYVICNADEGDPGAFMDRSVLESDPHRVLEGMLIAAYAVGASEGFIYVRAEYPLAIKRLKTAIRQAERLGLLGTNICGTRFSLRIDLRLGAGAFVCGEETALIASVEGKRGTPRPRPPYPAMSGLFGLPTLINNVETYANVPPIIRNGGAWYAEIGTEKSKGTKVFALAGRIENTGLVEVPMGITLRDIVYDIGGGIPEGRKFKAVQTGGPSGGCLPADCLDMPVDYESLAKAGSIMGSGGMIVMDESSCMVDVAKYFMDFCMTESCGKCVPCRVGTYQMHRILSAITDLTATEQDLKLLEELCDLLKNTSLCGLGQSAPNPVVSTLKSFAEEYRAHIQDKKCAAGVCGAHENSGDEKPEEKHEARELSEVGA
jgi:bidirectional [NiFe] hydrogenase diaphorase subunit